jgi:hypothetical protein
VKPQAFALARAANGSTALSKKAWPACRTAARGPTGCVSRHRSLLIDRIESLRRQRIPGKEIAATVGVSPATMSRVLKRLGLSKLSALEPAEPPRRYQRERPGEMIHIDIKKARQIQAGRPSHHRRPQGPEQPPRRRMGVPPLSASTTPRAWPSAGS